MTVTTIISIGARTPNGTLSARPWHDFRHQTLAAARKLPGQVVFYGTGHGLYGGMHEPSFTVIHTGALLPQDLRPLRHELQRLAAAYGQESIALTVSTDTELLRPHVHEGARP